MDKLYLPKIDNKYLAVLHEGSVRKKSGIKGYIISIVEGLVKLLKKSK